MCEKRIYSFKWAYFRDIRNKKVTYNPIDRGTEKVIIKLHIHTFGYPFCSVRLKPCHYILSPNFWEGLYSVMPTIIHRR